eukprot:5055719-Lingulodinium_polyedra.AAC.1
MPGGTLLAPPAALNNRGATPAARRLGAPRGRPSNRGLYRRKLQGPGARANVSAKLPTRGR